MKLSVLGSGSRGNAVLMQCGTTRFLIDAGFGPRAMTRKLAAMGVDPRSIEAVVVTHEHADHMHGVFPGAEKWGWQIYATSGTIAAMASLGDMHPHVIRAGVTFNLGSAEIFPVRISHDADDPVAIVATETHTGARAAIVYDLGMMSNQLHSALERVDVLVIESNHDADMLRTGPYPASVKRRIASSHGHLSNRSAAAAAGRCAHRGMSHIVLAHMSEMNNTPGIALDNMRRAIRRTHFRGELVASLQDAPTPTLSPGRAAAFTSVQLALEL